MDFGSVKLKSGSSQIFGDNGGLSDHVPEYEAVETEHSVVRIELQADKESVETCLDTWITTIKAGMF